LRWGEAELSFEDKCVPKLELGNEGESQKEGAVAAALCRRAGGEAAAARAPTERRDYSANRNFETGWRL
jgi:hypothetical protein